MSSKRYSQEQIWKSEGLSLRYRRRRKLRVARTEGPGLTGANEAWCVDFCFQRLENGRHARILGVLDCFTRECLLLKAAFQLPLVSGGDRGFFAHKDKDRDSSRECASTAQPA